MEYIIVGSYYFLGILGLGVLIVVHEFGHFIVAKLCGVKVLKFCVGFPPTLIKRKWGETEYAVGLIPLGGYVKLLGEDPESDDEVAPEDQQRSFTKKSLLARSAIIVAGPLSNFLGAVVMLTIGYLVFLPVLLADIGTLQEGMPAVQAGFAKGDRVIDIDGQPVGRWEDMRSIIEKSPGKELVVTVLRDDKTLQLKVTPQLSGQQDPLGDQLGRIGVMPSGATKRLGFFESFYEGARTTGHFSRLVVLSLVKLVKGDISRSSLSGPIGVIQASGESARAGVPNFLHIMTFISITLAVLNLLPIPVLDGGHLLFFAIEAVIRRPVTGRVREIAVQLGLLFIVFVMVFAIYNDFSRIYTQGWTLMPGK